MKKVSESKRIKKVMDSVMKPITESSTVEVEMATILDYGKKLQDATSRLMRTLEFLKSMTPPRPNLKFAPGSRLVTGADFFATLDPAVGSVENRVASLRREIIKIKTSPN